MSTTKHPKRPADFNQRAYEIFQEAVGEAPPAVPLPVQEVQPEKPPEREKDPAAVALGRKGGLKGGKARAEKLTPEERSEIGKKAAKARWARPEPGYQGEVKSTEDGDQNLTSKGGTGSSRT